MPIGEICTREVVIVEKSTSIQEAAKLMRQFHVGDLVIVESRDGHQVPIEILTDRDIVIELIAQDVDLEKVTVGDVMSFDLLTIPENQGIWETLDFMRNKGVRRTPVVDKQGALIGIISVDDLLELLADELNILAGLIRREQAHETKARV